MPKITIIEDDGTMLSLLKTLLEIEGFSVSDIVNPDIEQILPVLRQEKPNLILMDIHLCRVNGIDILTKIRKDPTFDQLKVIMSSGIDFKAKCMEQGANGFILKPYMPDDLIHMIRGILAN
jgi:DNA-binding response OmpR family regulator